MFAQKGKWVRRTWWYIPANTKHRQLQRICALYKQELMSMTLLSEGRIHWAASRILLLGAGLGETARQRGGIVGESVTTMKSGSDLLWQHVHGHFWRGYVQELERAAWA